ncbi:SDR family NAD(P)-dependent oxidoreductase [bacterium]|nr:SDR family NAD(P)-dependent oxidoreductase [bacterium]
MKMTPFLGGKVAWITGASRGIGRAVAVALARAGATVVVGARSEGDLAQLVESLRAEGHAAHAFPLDVASADSVRDFAQRSLDLLGPVSILVNNAGMGLFRDFLEMSFEEFDRQIDVNLKGTWYMSRTAAPQMAILGSGSIINVSSIAGEHAFKRGSAYCPAKAGVNALSEVLMMELRDRGIRVSTIAPGSVQTRFHREALPAANQRDESWMLQPEDVAAAVLHLLAAPEHALISHYEVRPAIVGRS